MDMKTSFIFLACLLAIAGANIEKRCNKTAEAIATQYCKLHCHVAEPKKECAMCIWNHQHYDPACKGETLGGPCTKTSVKIMFGDCKNKCSLEEPEHCDACIWSHKGLGLACWTLSTVKWADEYKDYEEYQEYQPLYSDLRDQ